MKNPDYDAEALAETVKLAARAAQSVAGQLYALTDKLQLTGEEYDAHAHDHAEEQLSWAANAARELADRCDRLRQYTNYPPNAATVGCNICGESIPDGEPHVCAPGFLERLNLDDPEDEEPYDASRKFSNLRAHPGMNGFPVAETTEGMTR